MKLHLVDAFTSTPSKGNPAAVCVCDVFPADDVMQRIAAELNLSETAFVKQLAEDVYHIRWFTPTTEVTLCGHATLAAATVLEVSGPVRFESLSGELGVFKTDGRVTLDFPVSTIVPIDVELDIVNALGGPLPVDAVRVSDDDGFFVYGYESFSDLEALSPNFFYLSDATPHAIVVTAPMDDYDYAVRVFAPQYGINEDPVTGSAQCSLAPYWQNRLKKDEFYVFQASKRTGELWVSCRSDRVEISGDAVVVGSYFTKCTA